MSVDDSIGISIDTLVEPSTDYLIRISIDAFGQALTRGLNVLTKLLRSALALLSNLSSIWMDSGRDASDDLYLRLLDQDLASLTRNKL